MDTEIFGAISQDEFDHLAWRTSTKSGGGGCVEIAPHTQTVWVRDSKNPEGGQQGYDRLAFAGFIAQLKQGEFNNLVQL